MKLDNKLTIENAFSEIILTPEQLAAPQFAAKIAKGMTYVGVPKTERAFYYRCKDCLTPVTIPGNTKAGDLKCACGGDNFEFLGRVNGYTWVMTDAVCNCDGRCTHAIGPNCDCKCGGRFHGAGLSAWSEVIVATGRVEFTAKCDEKTAELGRIFRETIKNAESAARIHPEIDNAIFGAVFKLKQAKTHKARLKYYARIADILASFAKIA